MKEISSLFKTNKKDKTQKLLKHMKGVYFIQNVKKYYAIIHRTVNLLMT